MSSRATFRLLPLVAAAALLAAPFVADAATLTVISTDGPNEGFNDPTPAAPVGGNTGTTLGQQRLNVFQRAADIWGATLASSVEIRVQSSFDPLFCTSTSAVLGGAGTIQIIRDFPGAGFPLTWYHTALGNALAGSDQIPGAPGTNADDIVAQFNSSIDNNNNCLSGTNWYLGLDNNPGGDIDLLVVVLHEFGHGLGFSNFVNETDGTMPQNLPDIYTRFSLDETTGLHWNEMTDAQRAASAVNTGNVVWDGNEVTTAAATQLTAGTNPSGYVRLYAPNPVETGSSISHYDTTVTPNALMEPFINDGLGSDLDLTDELMVDEGWTREGPCGNGVCEPGLGESCDTCAADCPSGPDGPFCGNGVCEPGEDCTWCSDCNGKQNGKPSRQYCCSGDGLGGGTNPVDCNDNRCGGPSACSATPVPGFCCGDFACDAESECDICDADCGGDPACDVTCVPTSSKEKGKKCTDGIDNDCDGLIDGDDPDC